MQVPPVSGPSWPSSRTAPTNPWLDHLGRGMWLRAHLSTFALGSVILLVINLLRGSGGIWADTAIGAWGVLVLAHGIMLVIARLLQELLSDEEEEEIRPSSEMRWPKPSTSTSNWSLPLRRQQRPSGATQTAPVPTAPPTSAMDPADAAAAAADRGKVRKPPVNETQPQPAPETPAPSPREDERVSWQAATDAAWLAPRPEPKADRKNDDDENDFTPLKFD